MANERYVTFVVHGVGSPKSVEEQVDEATNNFAKTWGRRNEAELKRTLYTAHPEHGKSIEYSVYEGRLEDGSTQEIVETQWADLSKAPSGFFSTAVSFMILLFDLRNISKVCNVLFKKRYKDAEQEKKSKRGGWTRFWGHYTIGFVEGPILGLNLLLIAAFLVALILKTPEVEWVRGLYVTLFGFVTIATGLGFKPDSEKLATHVEKSLPRNRMIWSVLLAILVGLYWVNGLPQNSWAAIMTGMLGMVLSYMGIKIHPSRVFLMNTCSLAGLVLVAISVAGERVLNPLVDFLRVIPFMVDVDMGYFDGFYGYVMIILAVVALAWLGVNFIFFGVSLGWLFRRDPSKKSNEESDTSFLPRTFDLQVFSNIFECRLWLIFIPVIWTLLLRAMPKGDESGSDNLLNANQIESLIDVGAAFNLLNLIVFALIIVFGAITFFQFNSRTKKGDKENKERLIVGNSILIMTNQSPILFALPFILDLTVTDGAIRTWLTENNHIGWAILIGIGIGGFWAREGIKNTIDFALDVTMYFNKENEVREEKDRGEAVVYDNIISRMQTIVDDVINRPDVNGKENRPDKVLFLTHSQGTALTRHFLAEHYDSSVPDSYFVTMGSPISHIYQHYFLKTLWHGPLNPKFADDRDAEPKRWLNMNRKSDYIGRRIDDNLFNVENVANDAVVEDENENKTPWYGGHTGYFTDEVVHKELEERGIILKNEEAVMMAAPEAAPPPPSSKAQNYTRELPES